MHWREFAQTLVISIAALATSALLYGVFIYLYAGVDPRSLFYQIYVGGFGSIFSISNTLTRAAPLILTALCMALPARVGLINIGGEGALMMGGLAAVSAGLALPGYPVLVVQIAMALAGMLAGGLLIAAVGWMRHARGINETISSLLLTYIVIAFFLYLVEGPLRDPASLNKPSTFPIPEDVMIGNIVPEQGAFRDFLLSLGSWMKVFEDVHLGLVIGIVFCVLAYLLMYHTTFGFAARMVGGNVRAAQASGLPVGRLMLLTCMLAGSAAGLAGVVQIAAVDRQANATLNAGYGFTGILVAFMARHHPLAIIPVAILFGSLDASAGLVQRELHVPDASIQAFKGIVFVVILLCETFYGRFRVFQPRLVQEAAAA
jgi:ABC-type uncharacterized transport system permease subunit